MVMDIGIVPLRDTPFNRAKSAIKGLEYAAAGVPFIAQNLDSYASLRNDLGVGRIAKRPTDWIRHIKELLDVDIRREEAARNRLQIASCDIGFGVARLVDIITNI
jgi:hypothetical protein